MVCYDVFMRRTTIFITSELWEGLVHLRNKKRKEATISELIREAIASYLKEQGILREEEKIKRALATRGLLSKDFEDRVRKAQKVFGRWNPESVWTRT